jgi:uncharacterized membrane protein
VVNAISIRREKMRTFITLVGIILIILGIVSLGYKGFTYTSKEKVAQFGNVEVTAENEKTISFSPMLGGAALISGVLLVWIGRNKRP